jgi:hypothetical protein
MKTVLRSTLLLIFNTLIFHVFHAYLRFEMIHPKKFSLWGSERSSYSSMGGTPSSAEKPATAVMSATAVMPTTAGMPATAVMPATAGMPATTGMPKTPGIQ